MGNNLTKKDLKNSKQFKLLKNCEQYFQNKAWKSLSYQDYNSFSIIAIDDEDRLKYSQILKKVLKGGKEIRADCFQFGVKTNRAIACFLGLAICDAFGASTEFIPFVKQRRDLIAYDFDDIKKQIQIGMLQPRFGRIGVWTDDCSMALCIADSLLINELKFNAKHIRFMFHMWLHHGLDNGGREHSIGLGGNIKISMDQFIQERAQYTAEKDCFNNGNGSLMRLAPIPILYMDSPQRSIQFAQKQSRTTHNGDQAKECAKLMSLIIVRLINRSKEEEDKWKEVIQQACSDFANGMPTLPSVQCLALSKMQSQEIYLQQVEQWKGKFTKFNKSVQDRNWNWKDPNFTYSKCRAKHQPGYIGSYCMDALAMALHTVWFSKSFEQVALINANMGGDCDTVGAIAGQIAGAIYGITPYMLHLYGQMQDAQKERYEVFLKAYKLSTKKQI